VSEVVSVSILVAAVVVPPSGKAAAPNSNRIAVAIHTSGILCVQSDRKDDRIVVTISAGGIILARGRTPDKRPFDTTTVAPNRDHPESPSLPAAHSVAR
jgi:hypothetical protein